MEHLDDSLLINTLKEILTDNGEILIAVPNEKVIEFNENNGALLDMPPNHIGRWSKSSLSNFVRLMKLLLLKILLNLSLLEIFF